MNWEQLILSQKSSKLVKEKIDIGDGCKYIGVLPIYWGNMTDKMDIDKDKMDIDKDNIKVINTTKSKTVIAREFYYLEKDGNKYYPVYKFLDDTPFTLREIKHKVYNWLNDEGFEFENEDNMDIFRIYKMMGFHLFVCLINQKTKQIKQKKKDDKKDIIWKCDKGIELLNLTNGEITNSFMKISNSKFNQKINNWCINNIWQSSLNGYSRYNLNECIIPYSVKWEEILATLANLIDVSANENLHLYFIPNIIEPLNWNGYNDISNLSRSISEPASDI
jgi:hypothetical protein